MDGFKACGKVINLEVYCSGLGRGKLKVKVHKKEKKGKKK